MGSKLYNVLDNIEKGRKLCIKNASLANLETSEDMNFDDIGGLFLLKNTPETIRPTWTRPSDWWDTETILGEAVEREDDSGVTVYPAYIILLDDSDKTTTFSKTTSNKALQGDSYLTSDGAWYGTTNATHTWDESKDKPCSLGYKTRYVIVYIKNKTTSLTINLSQFPCLELIFGDMTCTLNCRSNTKIQNIKANKNTNITTIGNNAFNSCHSLQSISLPSLTTINGDYAFNSCYSLQSISLPSLTTIIGVNTFYSCYSLQSISLPNITTISNNAFSACYSLQSISLPSLTTISGNYTFNGCSSLQSISLPSLTTISGDYAFNNCYSLQSISLPSLTTIIGVSTFYSCSSLQSISLPNITTISGVSTFYNCSSLQSISLPNITTIGSNTFQSCYSLSSITIPETIQQIPTTTTSFGSYLKEIILPNDFTLSLNLTGETSLTHSSLVNIIDKLKDVSEESGTYTLTLGTTNSAKLSSEEIAVATNKGWSVA